MKKTQIKTIHQTISTPKDVSNKLHKPVKLGEAYLSANKDHGQREVQDLWKETIADSLEDS